MVYFDFPSSRKVNLLEDCAFTLKRSPNLLEKDIHVVWALNALFASPIGQYLVFKGGTSVSKGFQIRLLHMSQRIRNVDRGTLLL